MQNAFFKSQFLGTGGYGRDGNEIIVASPGDITSPRAIGDVMRPGSGTNVLALPDSDPAASVKLACDLNILLAPNSKNPEGRKTFNHAIPFQNERDFEKSLRPKLNATLKFYVGSRGNELPLQELEHDMRGTVAHLSHVFNFEKGLTIRLLCTQEEKLFIHTDFADAADKRRAVRAASPFGTLFAPEDGFKMNPGGLYNSEFTSAPLHAGPGLVILAGNAKHAAPPINHPRWVYVVDADTGAP